MWDQTQEVLTLFDGRALRSVNGMLKGEGWDSAPEGMCS